MSLTFLRDNGARRVGRSEEAPDLFGDLKPDSDGEIPVKASVKLDFEMGFNDWQPVSVGTQLPPMALRPTRFIDGKDVGRTAAWMTSPSGRPRSDPRGAGGRGGFAGGSRRRGRGLLSLRGTSAGAESRRIYGRPFSVGRSGKFYRRDAGAWLPGLARDHENRKTGGCF